VCFDLTLVESEEREGGRNQVSLASISVQGLEGLVFNPMAVDHVPKFKCLKIIALGKVVTSG